MIHISSKELELMRDQTFYRTPAQKVHTIAEAEKFVNAAGFCFAFKAHNSELPCLWHAACGERNPAYPLHTHHDPYISLVWEAKDVLPAHKKIYYGKAIKNRPSMISLEYLPYFYCLHGYTDTVDNYLNEYIRGNLSHEAKLIMEALLNNSPMVTADLKLASGMANPDRRADFDKGMAELQMKMFIVKIAEFYEPFTFIWDLFTNRFPEEITTAFQTSPAEALKKILVKYFSIVLVSNPLEIKRLFGWPLQAVERACSELVRDGILTDKVIFEPAKKPFWGFSSVLSDKYQD